MPLLKYRRYRPNHAAVMVPAPSSPTITWNPSGLDSHITLSDLNLTATRNSGFDGSFYGVRGTGAGRSTGKYGFRATVGAASNTSMLCLANAAQSTSASPGSGLDAVAWVNNGGVTGAGGGASIDGYTSGDVLDFYYDLTAKLFFGRVNEGDWNANGSADPTTGVGGVDISSLNAGPYWPGCWFFVENAAFTADFGAALVSGPSGYGNP